MGDRVRTGDPSSVVTPEPVRSSSSLAVRSGLGAVWFSLWFFIVFPAWVLWWSGQGWALEFGLHFWSGSGLIAAAHVVLVAEIVAFARRGGTHVPLDPPPSLISDGLYGRVRNPMYASYIAIAIGEAIAYQSWALLGYSLLLAAGVHGYVIYVEEPGLWRRFGEDYERYTARSGRWFPQIRKVSSH